MASEWTVYGLKTCDTCRKACAWLAAEGIGHRFVDLRAAAPEPGEIGRWAGVLGEMLLNRRSTTWRGLEDAERATADQHDGLVRLCVARPALMKRPILVRDGDVLCGFTDAVRARLKAG